jgi:quercetin dioxygenase-like cupin family protein
MKKLAAATAAMAALAIVAIGATALATPGTIAPAENLLSPLTSAGRFDEIDARAKGDGYKLKLKTKGSTDLHVVRNTFQPGQHTGWHTHPGPSLITVTSGKIWVYSGDDRTCSATIYAAGQGFVDAGGGHSHILRNEGTVPAMTVAVQFLPAGTPRRIDTPAPGNCPF